MLLMVHIFHSPFAPFTHPIPHRDIHHHRLSPLLDLLFFIVIFFYSVLPLPWNQKITASIFFLHLAPSSSACLGTKMRAVLFYALALALAPSHTHLPARMHTITIVSISFTFDLLLYENFSNSGPNRIATASFCFDLFFCPRKKCHVACFSCDDVNKWHLCQAFDCSSDSLVIYSEFYVDLCLRVSAY